jgi:murein tripeptide amidase MpaA
MSYHKLTIEIEVTDKNALFAAAMKNADAREMGEEEALELLKPNGKVDVDACLQMLLDPGVSPDGAEIEQSSCECLFQPDPPGEDDDEDDESDKARALAWPGTLWRPDFKVWFNEDPAHDSQGWYWRDAASDDQPQGPFESEGDAWADICRTYEI